MYYILYDCKRMISFFILPRIRQSGRRLPEVMRCITLMGAGYLSSLRRTPKDIWNYLLNIDASLVFVYFLYLPLGPQIYHFISASNDRVRYQSYILYPVLYIHELGFSPSIASIADTGGEADQTDIDFDN